MRPLFFFIAFFCSSYLLAYQPYVLVENNRFLAPGITPYVETSIQVPANLISYHKNTNGKFQGKLEVSMLFIKDSLIVNYDRYILSSPEYPPTDSLRLSMIDKKRFSLENGKYLFQIILKDHLDEQAQEIIWEENINIQFDNEDNLYFSDIAFLESIEPVSDSEFSDENPFVKNDLLMVPLVLNFYPDNINLMRFYFEFYNADKAIGDDFLVTYSVRKSDNNQIINNLQRLRRQSPESLNGLAGSFDISDLPSGNYQLVVELRDRQNEVIASKQKFFQRSNPQFMADPFALASNETIENTFVGLFDIHQMDYLLNSFLPIASRDENGHIRSLIRTPDKTRMQVFIYNFWKERNPTQPDEEFTRYMEEIDRVNNTYGTNIEYGFQTDRGRVYLKYGVPSTIQRGAREPSALPYEVWHYYVMPDNQTNVRFIFYNPDLVSANFELIHSTARDEVYDPRWREKIYKDYNMMHGIDDTENRRSNHWGSRLEDIMRE